MIKITATAESLAQAQELISAGIDNLYIGEKKYGLRLPNNFSKKEIRELVKLTHQANKKVIVAVNGIMHPDKMKTILEYLLFLEELKVDAITVGDPGVIHLLRKNAIALPYIYDAHTMVTSAKQVNFWAKRGAIGAVLAREIPYAELKDMSNNLLVPGEILVYGATCIHQSLRPLVKNYLSYIKADDNYGRDRGLFLSEPQDENSHHSIFEDEHGTHIFAHDDINLLAKLSELYELGLNNWKLDGIFTRGTDFVEIVKCFVLAKNRIVADEFTDAIRDELQMIINKHHPVERSLATGFYELNPEDIK